MLFVAACVTTPPARLAPVEWVDSPIRHEFDGVSDDLLTAGLGPKGLLGAPPAFADAERPTVLELRRRAIYMNWRGLADAAALAGMAPGIAGTEVLVGLRSPIGDSTVMLQVPRAFNPAQPCLIAVASSGSRGIYGALPTSGGWGLRHGCAVVHTDKGTGTGAFDVGSGQGVRIDGTVAPAGDGQLSFAPDAAAVARLAAQRPHAVLFRHASSGRNVEAHWGEYLLQAIDVAFELLDREFAGRAGPFTPASTLVIAAGISNGGGTVLRALERDTVGRIDGAVVSEPNVSVPGFRLFGYETRPIYDLALANLLLQPCAVLAEEDPTAPFHATTVAARSTLEQWCRELAARGELRGAGINASSSVTTDALTLARAARSELLGLGILPEALRLGHFNRQFAVWPAIAVTYASAFGGFAPDELPCGVSFAATDAQGAPRALTAAELARLFADSSGIPPTAGVNLIAPGEGGSLRATTGSIDLALCLRGLRARLDAGIRAADAHPRADGRPLIVLHGRGDGLIPVNHTSRPYYLARAAAAGPDARDASVRYYEVERGQHFDAFLPLPGFAGHYVAMQPFLDAAMDLVAERLRSGAALPPSQVVREEILAAPGADAIAIDGQALRIPE
ncbi:MAG: hypothetical protein AMXMBFR52_17790 [Burkholderiales bacterium]